MTYVRADRNHWQHIGIGSGCRKQDALVSVRSGARAPYFGFCMDSCMKIALVVSFAM